MTGAWSELALVALAIGGPAAIAVIWQAIDDRRLEASIRRQLAEQSARREGAQS